MDQARFSACVVHAAIGRASLNVEPKTMSRSPDSTQGVYEVYFGNVNLVAPRRDGSADHRGRATLHLTRGPRRMNNSGRPAGPNQVRPRWRRDEE